MQDPGRYDFTIYQGATFDRTFTWRIGNPATAVNLAGYVGRMQLRTTPSAPTATLTINTTNGRMALGGAAGTIAISLTAAETADLPAGQYAYDLEMVSAGGEVTRLLEGRATVNGEVTR